MNAAQTLFPAWLAESGIQALIDGFAAAQQEIRFVGGAVRDTLLGRPVTDIDAATPAEPGRVMRLLEEANIRAIPTGLKHGTVTAVVDGRHIEITTLREDAACDGRHAEVRFTDSWQADAARRDFTMNALYLDAEGVVYDYFGGVGDAKAGRVHFIGDARARIREDYLRILRFFRFFATHGTPPADPQALDACRSEAAGIDALSGERIHSEMFKLLAAPNPVPALRLMEATGVLSHILLFSVDPARLARLVAIGAPADPLVRLAAFLNDGADYVTLAERWRLSGAEHKRLALALTPPEARLATLTESAVKKLIRIHGGACFTDWVWRERAGQEVDTPVYTNWLDVARHWQPPVFPVTGHDLLAHGAAPGKAMGEKLKMLEERWEASGYTLSKEALLHSARG